jgi:hypothetical protein
VATDTNAIRCAECIAFHQMSETNGFCRKHAPTASPIIMMTKSIQAGGMVPQVQVVTCWPTVKVDEGCLEFERGGQGSLIQ